MTPLSRVGALVQKEWQEYRGVWAPWVPGLVMLPVLCLPFVFTEFLPAWSGEPLEHGELAAHVAPLDAVWPALRQLPLPGRVRAFVFHQFLLAVVFVPISGAMSLAAHSLMGEKANRSLEPLLTTPLTTVELILAKALSAVLPAVVIEALAIGLYGAGIVAVGGVGVLRALVTGSSLAVVLLVGPLATLVAVQLVILASARARDPRSAQQVGVVLVLPLVGVVAAQSAGALWIGPVAWLATGLALAVLWLALAAASVFVFDAERMLTRWE